MLFNFITKIFGSRNDRLIKKYKNVLEKINSLEPSYSQLTNENLKNKYLELKNNYLELTELEITITSFAIVREISKRTLKMRHFDVQIIGGLALYDEKIAEIATGEGKTLVATLPACLYALKKKNTHIVTVNDYLTKRDASWMMPIYTFLDISVGIIVSNMTLEDKKKAYNSAVVYGTSSEFGFDYLRDNIITSSREKVQNDLSYVILDEVDSILIDEARTPLIISIPDSTNKQLYMLINNLIKKLKPYNNTEITGDFIIEEKTKQIYLTENGFNNIEVLLKKHKIIENDITLHDIKNIELLHIIYASLKAHYFFKKDIDYIIEKNNILIIDENTGRIMDGRRWGDGIHQAIEAKEGVNIKNENQTLATITFQNYFRLYKKKAGMTGTAITESIEFENIYGLEVVIIPPNKLSIRIDYADIIFVTKENKFKAIINDIKTNYTIGRPVLVGTTSIDISEFLSKMLKQHNIQHTVLNAKHHEKESTIIANAGNLYSVTIATNMAGRGTDIILGGITTNQETNYEKIIKLGGLKVIGVERHEVRRIDNQLRGRCGRQGDPGSSQFYLSLDDDLIRIFIGDKTMTLLTKLNVSDNETISHQLINKIIQNAQNRIEQHNYDIRKQLLEYDDIINEQRRVFYDYRNAIIFTNNFDILFKDLLIDIMNIFCETFYLEHKSNNKLFLSELNKMFTFSIVINNLDNKNVEQIKTDIIDLLYNKYILKKTTTTEDALSMFCKTILLNLLDMKWKEHLINLDILKSGIHLRGYAQKDPKLEYKNESFFLFKDMLNNAKTEFIIYFFNISTENADTNKDKLALNNFLIYNKVNELNQNDHTNISNKKIGRNDLCSCKSGKKYKHCHGKL